MAGQVIAIDFDHTAWDTINNRPMPGVHEAFDIIRMAGHRILIHSCNNPKWIRKMCDEHNLRVDYVWGETGYEAGNARSEATSGNVSAGHVCKPVCALYVDDRAHQFQGDWLGEVQAILDRIEGRPVKSYKGPNYEKNPKREAELKHRSRDCPNGFAGCDNCGVD
jgi:hypothetical protein